jgi:hypothetical protein
VCAGHDDAPGLAFSCSHGGVARSEVGRELQDVGSEVRGQRWQVVDSSPSRSCARRGSRGSEFDARRPLVASYSRVLVDGPGAEAAVGEEEGQRSTKAARTNFKAKVVTWSGGRRGEEALR